MLKVRRVITHSLYFCSPTRLLHESILQQGLIIQIKPTLCCIAEEGIGILKTCFPEGRRRGCEIFRHSQTVLKGTAGMGATQGGGSRGFHCRRTQLVKPPGEVAPWWLELAPRPSVEDELLSIYCISWLVGRLMFLRKIFSTRKYLPLPPTPQPLPVGHPTAAGLGWSRHAWAFVTEQCQGPGWTKNQRPQT